MDQTSRPTVIRTHRAPARRRARREFRKQLEPHQEHYVPDEFLRRQTRRDRRTLGAAAMLAGGAWLAFALAAL